MQISFVFQLSYIFIYAEFRSLLLALTPTLPLDKFYVTPLYIER